MFSRYIIAALAVALVIATLATFGYRKLYKATASSLDMLKSEVKRTNEEAARKLKLMTEAKDAVELRWKSLADAQEKRDETGTKQIALDSAVDRTRPVRVLVACPTGSSSQRRPAEATAHTKDSAGSADMLGGVLAPQAQQLVIGDRDAVERLQLAFNSCVAKLKGESE